MTHGKDWFDVNDPSTRHDDARKIPAPLPSITDMARHAAAYLQRADSPVETDSAEPTRTRKNHQVVLYDRDEALRELLTCYRAASLTDAITQLYAGFLIADDAANNEMAVADHVERADSLRRIFLSTLPILATSAGFDLAEIGADYIADYANHEFPGEA
jgi:hypothetical protein